MSLSILSITPENNNISVNIDSKIVIEVSESIDPFSVANGVNLYAKSDGLWDNKELATLDTKYSEVLDIGDVNTNFPFKYQILDNKITITPEISLLPDTTFYVDIFPGNDVTRYLSKRTVGEVTKVTTSGTISVNSSYTGDADALYDITFSSSDGANIDTIEVVKGIRFVGSFKFELGNEVNIGDLKLVLGGDWDITDSISIPVYKASGLTEVYRINFTTTKYTTVEPKSHKIEYISDTAEPFSIVSMSPEDLSINNSTCNPIVIRFNKALKQGQDLSKNIRIKRTGIESGVTRNINQYYKIEGDILKIYMISTSRI